MSATTVPNFDDMDVTEIRAWWQCWHGRSRQLGRAWFAEERNRTWIAGMLLDYALNKAIAMEWRLKGNVKLALSFEATCDRLYQRLPECARW